MSFEMKYDRDGNVINPMQPVVSRPEPSQEPVVQESEHQEVEQLEPIIEAQESVEEIEEVEAPAPTTKSKPTPAESFRELKAAKERSDRERERIERERDREREEFNRRLRELEDRNRAPQKASEPEEDLNVNINPEDLVEGRHLSKYNKKMELLEKRLEQYERNTTRDMIKNQLKAQYPDFESIVSQENLERLQHMEPEFVSTLNDSKNLYATGVAAYKMIKATGISKSEQYAQDAQRAQVNAAKPRPLAAVAPQQSESPLTRANSFANGLTEDLKKQLHKEMVAASKNM